LLFVILSESSSAAIYNARTWVNITWKDTVGKPIVPRDEIKKLNLSIEFRVDTGPSFGEGLLLGWQYTALAMINLEIVDHSPWCMPVLKNKLVTANLTWHSYTSTELYLSLSENAPAYGEGFVKIKAKVDPLNLIEGYEDEFVLFFTPSYLPIIDVYYPEFNTKKVKPGDDVVFPIEVKNMGNARTKVFFEIEDLPKGWYAAITDQITLNEEKGSKEIAYLSITSPTEFGYHYDKANIKVKITPARAENTNEMGHPLYATFIIESRGYSSSGIEGILPLFTVVIILVSVIVLLIKRKINK